MEIEFRYGKDILLFKFVLEMHEIWAKEEAYLESKTSSPIKDKN